MDTQTRTRTRTRNEFREMVLMQGLVVAVVFAGFLSVVTVRVLLSVA